MSITRGGLAQSPEPEARDNVLDNNPDSKMEFGNVGFRGEGKTGVPREKPPEQGREPTTNSTHI